MPTTLQQGERKGRKEGLGEEEKEGDELMAPPPPSLLLAELSAGNSGGEGRESGRRGFEEPPVSLSGTTRGRVSLSSQYKKAYGWFFMGPKTYTNTNTVTHTILSIFMSLFGAQKNDLFHTIIEIPTCQTRVIFSHDMTHEQAASAVAHVHSAHVLTLDA